MADGSVRINNSASGETGVEIIQASAPIDPPFVVRNSAGTTLVSINTNGNTFVSRLFTNVRTITVTGAAAATDHVLLVDCTAGAVTLTLTPAIQFPPGTLGPAVSKSVTIIKLDNTANNLTIARAGADLINGAATLVLTTQFQRATLISDGVASWFA